MTAKKQLTGYYIGIPSALGYCVHIIHAKNESQAIRKAIESHRNENIKIFKIK